MDSNRFQLFLYENGKKKINPIVLVFLAIQLLLIIIIFIIVAWINSSNDVIDNDAERYEKLPELTIENLADKVSALTESEIKSIQKKVFEIVSENSKSINVDIKAKIRDDNVHYIAFDRHHTSYLNMTIDIPNLEQSYEVFYSSNAVIDPEVPTYVLCLEDDADIVYKDFKCKSSDDESIRDTMIETFIKFFDFDYFSAYISTDDSSTIVIDPSITYDNDEATKKSYIAEAKGAVESLGFSPDKYNYYVRTAADVDYINRR